MEESGQKGGTPLALFSQKGGIWYTHERRVARAWPKLIQFNCDALATRPRPLQSTDTMIVHRNCILPTVIDQRVLDCRLD